MEESHLELCAATWACLPCVPCLLQNIGLVSQATPEADSETRIWGKRERKEKETNRGCVHEQITVWAPGVQFSRGTLTHDGEHASDRSCSRKAGSWEMHTPLAGFLFGGAQPAPAAKVSPWAEHNRIKSW